MLLVVDDDDATAFFVQRAFGKAHIPVTIVSAVDGEAAIDYLSHNGKYQDEEKFPVPDLVLLDLNMPRVDGFEVLAWKRGQPRLENLPVVVYSSLDMPEDEERAKRLGAHSYIEKQMDLDNLSSLIAELEKYAFQQSD